jgi:hypothetical protein
VRPSGGARARGAGRGAGALLIAALLLAAGCERTPPAEKVDLSRREPIPMNAESVKPGALRIAVGGKIGRAHV